MYSRHTSRGSHGFRQGKNYDHRFHSCPYAFPIITNSHCPQAEMEVIKDYWKEIPKVE